MKKADRKKTDLFEIRGRALQIPWAARKTNRWVLEQIKPETKLEEKMTKQKLFYSGYNIEDRGLWKR